MPDVLLKKLRSFFCMFFDGRSIFYYLERKIFIVLSFWKLPEQACIAVSPRLAGEPGRY